MSDPLARFVTRRTTYDYREALRQVREARPALAELRHRFGWTGKQAIRRLVIDRWAIDQTGAPVREIICSECSAPEFTRIVRPGDGHTRGLCRACLPLTALEAREVYAAAVAANFRRVVKGVDPELAVRGVLKEAKELPELSGVPSSCGWDRYREREVFWARHGLTADSSTGVVAATWDDVLREAGAPTSVGRGGQDRPRLDHEYAISTDDGPRRRGIVGDLYYTSRLELLIREVEAVARLAQAHGLLVVLGAFSTWYPRDAIRVEVLGPALAERLCGRKALRHDS